MEINAEIRTALDLKRFLATIPDIVLERLFIDACSNDGEHGGDVDQVQAFEYVNNDGTLESGLRFNFTG